MQVRPSEWVSAHLAALPDGQARTLLDVACGGGRHLRLALQRGYAAAGIDRDISAAAASGLAEHGVELIEADLEDASPWPLGERRFHAVVVTNYLWRARLPDIVSAVSPDGILIYETFAAGRPGLVGPSNPDFLLKPGELLEAVRDKLIPFAYEQVAVEGPRLVQRIAAAGPRHA